MNKPVLISAAAVLATGMLAALLWPDPPGSRGQGAGIADSPLAAVAQETTAIAASKQAPEQRAPAALRPPSETLRRSIPDLETIQKLAAENEALQKRYAESVRVNTRKSLEKRFDELGKALDLTPEEVYRILEILAGEQQFPSPVMTQKQEDELRSVLGGKYDKWLAFGLAPEIRTTMMRFQDVFGPDANPLSDEQTESVVAALAAEQVRINRDMSSIPHHYGNDSQSRLRDQLDRTLRYSAENNRRLEMAASPYLNVGQLIAYREMLREDMNRSIESIRAQIETREKILGTGLR